MGKPVFNKVFITGGAGYVGSALVPKLLENGYAVTIFDLFLYGDALKDHPKLHKIKGDIRDKELLKISSKDADAFIHLACISNDPSFDLDPNLGRSINYEAFDNVIEAVKKGNTRRLIIASSTSQYGIKDPKTPVTEETEAEPITDYARYKLECEKKLREEDMEDIEYVFVRPATIAGYAPRLRLDLVTNILTINALVNKKIKIFGGEQLRPTLNIKDMVRFYELMLTAPKEKIHKQAFNVADKNQTVIQIGELVRSIIGKDIPFEVIETDDNRSYHVDSSKAKKFLGFECENSLSEAIESLVRAYKDGLVKDGLNNPLYYNIKQMQLLKLK